MNIKSLKFLWLWWLWGRFGRTIFVGVFYVLIEIEGKVYDDDGEKDVDEEDVAIVEGCREGDMDDRNCNER